MSEFDIPQARVSHSCGHFIGVFEPLVRWKDGNKIHEAKKPYGGVIMICPGCSKRFAISSSELATPHLYADKNDDGTWSMDVETDGLPVPEILLMDAMVALKAAKSRGKALNLIKEGKVSINNEKITDLDITIPPYSGDLLKVGQKTYNL
jgi:hypothetical protein